ncbi:site-specific DNA-methyltransferase [Comamonas thiooxydans]|uniref:site-specific DNA-methyltransferase n=1 Tax=Comamonas thiooxydans TaxID=363952 RepID=UPI000B413A57|nr:site-specific DNA-methyltransferase [Comamonas thiooxydans]
MQLDLFSSVLHAYAASPDGLMKNSALYATVGEQLRISEEDRSTRVPVGQRGELHNLFNRKCRWVQQTLRASGILERVAEGVWGLTQRAGKDLSQIPAGVSVIGFSTDLGVAILGSCDSVFSKIDSPITLCVTSPPYPLRSARSYGNVDEVHYVDWICKMLEPLVKNLVPGGSIALNISQDIFMPGSPERSMYAERLLLAMHDRLGLRLMDRLIWANFSKPPGPFQYASKARTQLNVAYEPIYWLTNDCSKVKSNNRRVLMEHTEKHLKLIQGGGEHRTVSNSDGAYTIRPGSYGNPTEGRIPRNILTFGHRCKAQSDYKAAARAMGLPAHGAPMPLKLAEFLIKFLSEPGDLVVDPFGGSQTTADAAERLGRHWLTTEVMAEYVLGGSTRFKQADGFNLWLPERMAA